MSQDHPGWADNIERMFRATLRLVDRMVTKNRPLFWIVVLGACITLGVFDVPVFQAIVEGLVQLAAAAFPGLGG